MSVWEESCVWLQWEPELSQPCIGSVDHSRCLSPLPASNRRYGRPQTARQIAGLQSDRRQGRSRRGLWSAVHLTRHLLPLMRAQQKATIARLIVALRWRSPHTRPETRPTPPLGLLLIAPHLTCAPTLLATLWPHLIDSFCLLLSRSTSDVCHSCKTRLAVKPKKKVTKNLLLM